MSELILASSSPRRQDLLRLLGLKFRVVVGHMHEDIDDELPELAVESLARHKADATAFALSSAATTPDYVVIAADTVVVIDDEILGKPASPDAAKSMLRRLSGRQHRVLTGVALRVLLPAQGTAMFPPGSTDSVGHIETRVRFRVLSDEQIDSYVASGEPMDKAGAYGIQGPGAHFVSSITGDYFNVVGLPLEYTREILLPYFPEIGAVPPPPPAIKRRAEDPDPLGRVPKPEGRQ